MQENDQEKTSPRLPRLVRGTMVYGVGSILNRAVTFLMLPILTRFLSPAEYGVSAILDVLCAFLVAIFSLGFGSSLTITYFDSEDPGQRRRSVSTAFVVLLASVCLLAVLGFAGSGTVSGWILGDGSRGDLIILCLGTTAMMILPIPFGLRLQYEERAVRQVTLNLVSTIFIVSLSLAGVVWLDRGVKGLWEGRMAAHAITFLLFAAHFPFKELFRLHMRKAVELLRHGLPMVPAFASLFVLLQGNRYILSLFADMDVVGIYSAGVQFGMVMGMAVSAFTTAWTPYFMSYKDKPEEAPRVLSMVATYYVLGFGLLSLMFYIWARPVVLVMIDPAYHLAFMVTGLAASTQFMIGMFNVLQPQCIYAREIKFSSLVQAAAAVFSIAINLLLIPAFGLVGAGLALALGAGSMALLMYLWNIYRRDRYLEVSYRFGRIIVFALFYIVLGGAMMWRRELSLAAETGLAVAASLVAAGAGWMLLRSEEKESVLAYARKRIARED